MSRVLITGASGFIGGTLIAALAGQGRVLRAAVRRPPPYWFPAGVEVIRHADLMQDVDWRPALDGVDAVIHLAGIADVSSAIAAQRYDRINRAATELLANEAAEMGVERFVFVSSIRAQCWPSADHALTERDTPAPADAYGRSKLAAEAAVGAAGVPFTILRPAALYGPGAKGNVAFFFRLASTRWPLPVRGLAGRRSLLGIDNFVSAVKFALSTPAAANETYVIADPGRPLRLADIIETLRRARNRRPLLLPMPPLCLEIPLRLVGRSDLWQRLDGDLQVEPAKLIAAGWVPLHDTPTGLAALMASVKP
jgi:nucleoside-diphosphate-sugar epimerase